ncbi:unnamed protein product [Didymodactylos carnosus]|uniref:Uncharacterized protein n=1 Tax=Didymodactylos carnosus TaxID=1234261 RepID=A0A815XUB6_9BILA|nr:unnamed protein product [Didymodactylos carnosus]CAF4423514.1 unnamed protein product [Didymodactylos carnosus]
MFDELRKNGILLLYVIIKWPFIPETEQKAIVNEAVGLLGGRKRAIYPIKEGGGTRSSKKHFRAYECEPKKSYIIPVNSKPDKVMNIRVPKMGLNSLRKILISKLNNESQSKLIELYKENVGFWSKLGLGALEILDDIGIPRVNTEMM